MNKLPDNVLSLIFSYLSVKDLCTCCRTSRRWGEILDANNYLWKQRLYTDTPQAFTDDPILNDLDTSKDKLIAYHCTWSESDHSHNIYIKDNKLTIHRNPVAQSSDLARGKTGFSSGHHYWTVTWLGPKFGSSAVVGVATKNAKIVCEGYHALLGSDAESWGWDLSDQVLRHDGRTHGSYPQESKDVKVDMKLDIGVTLDMTNRTLAFDVDGKYLGIAFRDLPNVELYPAVSAVYGNTEVSLVYRGSPLVG